MMYLDFHEWLPANLLLRGDRMTMAHSLELRCPFMDHRFIEQKATESSISLRTGCFCNPGAGEVALE